MKRIIILMLVLCSLLASVSCDSSGGDDLPSISEAPYSSRKAFAIAMQAVLDILYDYAINGSYPNVSESGNTLTFSNAVKSDVTFDYSHYQVNLTGRFVLENENLFIWDFSLVRCKSYSETLYCTLYIVQEKRDGVTKITKFILDGTEYEPE